jgi:hypothetical protein
LPVNTERAGDGFFEIYAKSADDANVEVSLKKLDNFIYSARMNVKFLGFLRVFMEHKSQLVSGKMIRLFITLIVI